MRRDLLLLLLLHFLTLVSITVVSFRLHQSIRTQEVEFEEEMSALNSAIEKRNLAIRQLEETQKEIDLDVIQLMIETKKRIDRLEGYVTQTKDLP